MTRCALGKSFLLVLFALFLVTTSRSQSVRSVGDNSAGDGSFLFADAGALEVRPNTFSTDLPTEAPRKSTCRDLRHVPFPPPPPSLFGDSGSATASDRSCENKPAPPETQSQLSLLPMNTCQAPPSLLEAYSACLAMPALHYTAWTVDLFPNASNAILFAQRSKPERFHWRPALLQSLGFLLLEHGFRLASDPYARYLLFHKPFWKDYLSSAQHFDMNRWGDGDDFIVNYIGHPLEGSVSGNIFIQNDPQGRGARFGKSAEYWESRFKAMAWAAVYSAYFEIGPVLSETALGNEGGYTYIPGCGFYPTCPKEPGKTYKPPTNNTGWVDFIVTPTVGMGWIVLEDFIEADILDKLITNKDTATYRILRGSLSPSRSLSNMLSGQPPWRRYSDARETGAAFGRSSRSLEWPAWKDDPRLGFGVQTTSISLPMDWQNCSGCRAFATGAGVTFAYRLSRLVYFDSEFNFFPGSSSEGGRGAMREGLFGVKVGHTGRSWGFFAQMRPGFVHYDKALVPMTSSDYESTTRFAFDLGGSAEYYASRHSTIRFNLGTTLIHYLTGRLDPRQPPVGVLSTDLYATQGSFRVTSGYVFRF